MSRFAAGVLAALTSVASAALLADSLTGEAPPPLVTDRPTDSVAPVVVPPRHLQVEGGYRFSRFDEPGGDLDNHVFPDLLLRYGVNEKVEARLFASGWLVEDGPGDSSTEFSDITVGAKVILGEEDGLKPASALLLDLSVPSGSDAVSNDYYIPKVLFVGAHTLSDSLALTYNLGPSLITYKEEGDRESDWDLNYAVALSGPLSNSLSYFAEVFGAYVFGRDLPDRHNLQLGVAWLLGPRLQLDIRAGAGLVSDEAEWFAGAGVSYRFGG